MSKSYVPQLIRLLRHIRVYINKHRSVMNGYLSGGQSSALDAIVTAIGTFDGVDITETP